MNNSIKEKNFMDKKELVERLISLDKEVSMVIPNAERITMTIVGGGALILQGYLNRVTMDIDLIDIYYPVLAPILDKYDVNYRSNAFSDNLAENYLDRLVKVDLNTKIIDYYVLSLEDLVIMKLFSTRAKDWKDIREKEVTDHVNWDLLKQIVTSGEADNTFNTRVYKEFLERYEDYLKENNK